MTSSRQLQADGLPADGAARVAPTQIHDLSAERSIAYTQCGAGPDCLVLHGTLMTLEDMWVGPTPALAEHFRVTAIDRPGHGTSRRARMTDASPWRQAAILHDFAKGIGLERPVIVGHSYGGTVALAYAILYPDETAGVVALAPMCLPEVRVEAMLFGPRGMPGFGDVVTPLLGASVDPFSLPLLWRAMFLPQLMPSAFASAFPFPLAARFGQMIAEGEDASALMPALVTMAGRYGSCRVPARILGGTADIVVNNALQGQVAAALMPEGSFRWIVGVGHMSHHFEQAAIVEAAREVADGD